MNNTKSKLSLGNSLIGIGFFLVGFGLGEGIVGAGSSKFDFTTVILVLALGFVLSIVGEHILNTGVSESYGLKEDRRFLISKPLNLLGSGMIGFVFGRSTAISTLRLRSDPSLFFAFLALAGAACLIVGSVKFYQAMRDNLF